MRSEQVGALLRVHASPHAESARHSGPLGGHRRGEALGSDGVTPAHGVQVGPFGTVVVGAVRGHLDAVALAVVAPVTSFSGRVCSILACACAIRSA